jgi:ABC-2 type transport system permease protein
MNAQTLALGPSTATRGSTRGGTLLGVGTFFRKEVREWVRGRRAIVVGFVALASALFTTVVQYMVGDSDLHAGPPLSMDPTYNVLVGWAGQTFAIIVLLASMSLLSAERDRGTLAWSLTLPVSPTSILLAKWLAAVVVLAVVAVAIPLTASIAVATVVYGGVPDIAAIALFAVIYLAVPAFYVALTLALSTAVKSTGGIAGIGFLVMFLPSVIGALVPVIGELSPTGMGSWAIAIATGQPASPLTLIGFLGSMAVLAIGAKLIFDRREV